MLCRCCDLMLIFVVVTTVTRGHVFYVANLLPKPSILPTRYWASYRAIYRASELCIYRAGELCIYWAGELCIYWAGELFIYWAGELFIYWAGELPICLTEQVTTPGFATSANWQTWSLGAAQTQISRTVSAPNYGSCTQFCERLICDIVYKCIKGAFVFLSTYTTTRPV